MKVKRKRLAFVVNNLNVGGLERVVINLIKGLDQTLFDIYIVCLDGKGKLFEEIEREIKGSLILNKKDGIDIYSIIVLRNYFVKNRIQIVHSHNHSPMIYSGAAIKLILFNKPKLLFTEHNQVSRLSGNELNKLSKYLKMADRIFTVSKSLIMLYKDKLNTNVDAVLYNGVPESVIYDVTKSRIRKEKELSDTDFVLCTVAILKKQKGLEYLIKALSELKNHEDIKLLIAGSGILLEELEKQVHRYGLENKVFFLGYRRDLGNILSGSDVFVLSSIQEGLPMSIIEALAVGLPVITTDVGGCSELVIDNENGIVINSGSSGELADAILKLYKSREELGKYTQKNRERYKQLFSLDAMVNSHVQEYQ